MDTATETKSDETIRKLREDLSLVVDALDGMMDREFDRTGTTDPGIDTLIVRIRRKWTLARPGEKFGKEAGK